MKAIIEELNKRFTVEDTREQRDNLSFVTVPKREVISALQHLKRSGFTHLVLLTAVDWIEDNKFQLTYLLNNPGKKVDLGLRTLLDRENPEMETAHHCWPTAATYQRELREMFGINFPGSPNVDEEFILEGWEGMPPYRRDFDTLKYAEETYFPRPGRSKEDPKDYMKKKLYGEWRDDRDV